MLKLIRFEFFRKKTVFLVAFLMVFLGEAYAMFKYFQLDEAIKFNDRDISFGILTIVLMLGFVILYLVDIITLLRQDMFKQEGYMLFMTPFNGYQILGSKVIFALIEGFFIAVVFLVLTFANAKLMNVSELTFNWDISGISFNEWTIIIRSLLLGILSIVEFALTIFLSFALFKSIFTNVRFKGAITFGIFIAINFIKAQIFGLMLDMLIKNGPTLQYGHYGYESPELMMALNPIFNTGIIYILVMSSLLFIATGYLLENKINL